MSAVRALRRGRLMTKPQAISLRNEERYDLFKPEAC